MTTQDRQVNVAVVGLGFGEAFLPIYAAHPDVGRVGIADPSTDRLQAVGARHGIDDRYTGLDEVLADDVWDAVHILAPVSFHADYSVRVLEAGKHCACAVPMGMELEDLERVVAAERRSGKRYMMMETSVYGREYLLAQRMHGAGELGELTFYRGYHVQNLDGFPSYWRGFPPMKYLAHALSPLLALTGTQVADVVAHGSGVLSPDRVGAFDNRFPIEAGLFRLTGSSVVADVTMAFFQTAKSYTEGFSVYGDARSLEWNGVDGDPVDIFELQPLAGSGARGRPATVRTVDPPDHTERLPSALVPYVGDHVFTPHDGGPAVTHPAGHGGSHPYLVDEFVSSIVADRPAAIDAVVAAAWTAPGICAHRSAMSGGERVDVPQYDLAQHDKENQAPYPTAPGPPVS